MKQQLSRWLLLVSLLLLPLQTRWIFGVQVIGGEVSQYGAFSIYVVEMFIAVAYILRGRLLFPDQARKIVRALYLVGAVGFFSLALSDYASVGWSHMIHVLSATLLFSLLLDLRTDLKEAAIAFTGGLLFPALIGMLQVLTGQSGASTLLGMAAKDVQEAGVAVVETAQSRTMRAYGTFPHPNIFGGYLMIGLGLLAWLARFMRTRVGLFMLMLPVIILSASLIITFSRSAWFGLIAFGLTLVIGMLLMRRMPPSRAIPLATIGLVTLFATMLLFHNQIIARFDPSLRVEAISVEERASQYYTFNDVFFSAPLLGVGPGGYIFRLVDLEPGYPAWSYQPIHNAFLLIMAELGIIGFLVVARWVWMIDHRSFLKKRTANGLFAIAVGAGLLILALLDHYIWSLWPGLALAAIAFAYLSRWTTKDYEGV